MSVLRLCDTADLALILGDYGIIARADDDNSGGLSPEDEAGITWAIRRASQRVLQRLRKRYAKTDITGANPPTNTPEAVKLLVMDLAIVDLASRRGNPASESLARLKQEAEQAINDVVAHRLDLDGVADTYYAGVSAINFTPDMRFRFAKIRTVAATSSGQEKKPDDGYKEHPLVNIPSHFD